MICDLRKFVLKNGEAGVAAALVMGATHRAPNWAELFEKRAVNSPLCLRCMERTFAHAQDVAVRRE